MRQKIILILILCFTSLFSSQHRESYSNFFFESTKDQKPEPDKQMGKVLDEVINILSQKYGVYPVGIGMGGKFKRVSLEMEIQKSLTKDEIREFLLETEGLLIEKINSNKLLRAYLKDYPFTYENVSATLFLKKSNSEFLYYPDISVAGICSDGLDFCTNDPEKKFGYKTKDKESIEEASAKVEKYHAQKLTASNLAR